MGPDCRVLIWLGEGPLSLATPGFTSVDYLLDGLPRGHLAAQAAATEQIVFSHLSFGRACWVVYSTPGALKDETFALIPVDARTRVVVYAGGDLDNRTSQLLSGTFSSQDKVSL